MYECINIHKVFGCLLVNFRKWLRPLWPWRVLDDNGECYCVQRVSDNYLHFCRQSKSTSCPLMASTVHVAISPH